MADFSMQETQESRGLKNSFRGDPQIIGVYWGLISSQTTNNLVHVQAQSWELNVYDIVSSVF